MAVYTNGTRHGMTLGGFTCDMELFCHTPITNGTRLLSLDDYILKDTRGVYLTTVKYIGLSSLNDEILKESNELYLIVKESD